jgi:hypothetical protein
MRRNGIAVLLAVVVLSAPFSDALGFDGNREGFVLGFGGGYGGLFEITQNAYNDASGKGVLTELVIGHGVSKQWLIHYSGRQIWGSTKGILYTAVFPSVAATHFHRDKSPSIYEMGSLGIAAAGDVAIEGGRGGGVAGPAAFLGIGYEAERGFGFELVGGVLGSVDNGTYGAVGLTMKLLAY